MKKLAVLFDNNRAWARRVTSINSQFFEELSKQQTPRYLWIGCSDSRVPATEICGLTPGEMFVHRNVANMVIHTDFNCLAVVQYAVDVLKVTDIMVCGHYGCGGVATALEGGSHGLIDNWLRHIKDVYTLHQHAFADGLSPRERVDRLCELNVLSQVANLCYTTIVQDAWSRGQELAVHGWIYGLEDGLLKDLDLCVTELANLPEIYRM